MCHFVSMRITMNNLFTSIHTHKIGVFIALCEFQGFFLVYVLQIPNEVRSS